MKNQLPDRLLEFAVSCINFTNKCKTKQGEKYIANQLMRSASSSGANYEEACGAESKADFIHKLQLVLKELRESLYWIKLLQKTYYKSNSELTPLRNEAEELVKII